MIKSSKCLCRSYKRISLFLYSFNVKVKPFNKCTPSTSLDASWGLKRLFFFLSLAFFFLVTTWHHDYPLCNSTADNSVRDLGAFWVQLLKPGAARLKEATRSSPQRSDNVTFNSTPPRCFFNFPCSLQTWPTRVTSLEAIYQVFFSQQLPLFFLYTCSRSSQDLWQILILTSLLLYDSLMSWRNVEKDLKDVRDQAQDFLLVRVLCEIMSQRWILT